LLEIHIVSDDQRQVFVAPLPILLEVFLVKNYLGRYGETSAAPPSAGCAGCLRYRT
jgi:hypothetical protein